MKILHIYRGYGDNLINPVIDNQIATLSAFDDIVYTFIINRGGIRYLTNILKLKRFLRKNEIEIIHTHYSFSGFMAGLAFSGKPIVCSLMGSDVLGNVYMKKLIAFFIKRFWARTIVKSDEMQKVFYNTLVISNGVDFANFSPKPINEAFERTGLNPKIKNIIFIATNPYSEVKNHTLAKEAIEIVKKAIPIDISLHFLSNIDVVDLPYYYSAADLLLLTSKSEGSPNVVKEAMACNCPIVSTDVGDVREVIANTAGCWISSFEPSDVATKIILALKHEERTDGRTKIDRFDSKVIAAKIIAVYKSCRK